MTHRRNKNRKNSAEFDDTKAHLFLAGREILLAAEGVLKFCKTYVEKTGEEKSHPNIGRFFSRGLIIAKGLASSMANESPVKTATKKIVGPIYDAIEKEMSKQRTGRQRRKKGKK